MGNLVECVIYVVCFGSEYFFIVYSVELISVELIRRKEYWYKVEYFLVFEEFEDGYDFSWDISRLGFGN